MSDVTLTYPGGELPLARVPATVGNDGFDVSALLKTTGAVTLDSGFTNTASCTSAITFIDGDAGILRYRGYPIEQLAKQSTFLETSYLLVYGALPTPTQLTEFESRVKRHTMLHEDLRRFFDGFPRDAHPMPVLSSAVSALSTFYQDSLDPFDQDQVDLSTIRHRLLTGDHAERIDELLFIEFEHLAHRHRRYGARRPEVTDQPRPHLALQLHAFQRGPHERAFVMALLARDPRFHLHAASALTE